MWRILVSVKSSPIRWERAEILGAGRDEITTDLNNSYAIAFSGGRAYVTDENLA